MHAQLLHCHNTFVFSLNLRLCKEDWSVCREKHSPLCFPLTLLDIKTMTSVYKLISEVRVKATGRS